MFCLGTALHVHPMQGMKALSQPLPQTHEPHQDPFSEDRMPDPSPPEDACRLEFVSGEAESLIEG